MKERTDSFRIAMLLKELYSKTMHTVESDFRESNLTHQQVTVIKFLGHNGELTISQLCNEMLLAKGTVSGIVSRLEKNGFIEKFKKNGDQRNTYIRFSSKGEKFAENFKNKIQHSFDSIFENCTGDELDELANSLRKVLSKI